MEVLVAESSTILRSRLVRIVQSLPGIKTVFEAENFSQLERIGSQKAPELIVLDLFLPEGKGFEMLTELLKDPKQQQYVVLLDSYDDVLAARAKKLGALAVYAKSDNLLALLLKLNYRLRPKPTDVYDQSIEALEFTESSQSRIVTHN
ncbi:MAG: response regulator [Gammaproteobacteria bacterium]